MCVLLGFVPVALLQMNVEPCKKPTDCLAGSQQGMRVMTPTSHPLWFLRESPSGSFPTPGWLSHSLSVAPASSRGVSFSDRFSSRRIWGGGGGGGWGSFRW